MRRMTSVDWSSLKHFRAEEFTSPDSMSYQLLRLLDSARVYAGIPFVINSSFRSWPEGSSHAKGYAVDIATDHRSAYVVVRSLMRVGLDRIVVYDSHVHVDCDPDKPHPVLLPGVYYAASKDVP